MTALERKRRALERNMADPQVAREAEVVFNHFAALRAAIQAMADGDAPQSPRAARDVDHYAVLGLQPTASFRAIERAYRAAEAGGTLSPEIQEAWRVLGDPLARATFDRRRRMGAVRTSPSASEADPTAHDAEPSSSGRMTVEVPGPEQRDIHLEDDGPAIRTVVIVVRGPGAWRARIDVDHPCLSTTPEDTLRLAEGRHTIAVRIDPTHLSRAITSCTITLSSTRETHTVAFRIHQAPTRALPRKEILVGLAAVALVGAGWWIGQSTVVRMPEQTPASQGAISQVKAVDRCFSGPEAPQPSWVDIHVDGLGRPVGFHIEGPTAPAADACVRDALKRLEFPPTKTGLPAFHRYHHRPPERTR